VATVQDGQYYIEASGGRGGDWLDPQDGLTTGQDNWVAVITGTQWGQNSSVVDTGWPFGTGSLYWLIEAAGGADPHY
jgi:hypothetical protein